MRKAASAQRLHPLEVVPVRVPGLVVAEVHLHQVHPGFDQSGRHEQRPAVRVGRVEHAVRWLHFLQLGHVVLLFGLALAPFLWQTYPGMLGMEGNPQVAQFYSAVSIEYPRCPP